MSPKGRPEGESTPKRVSAEGSPASPKGRPEGESTPKRVSAEGSPASPKGRPKGESAPKRVSPEGGPASTPSDVPPVLVTPGDLPVYCPNSAMPLWSSHPRVFLDVGKSGAVRCPYCSTEYRLVGDARAGHR